MRAKFIRGLDPKEAMKTGMSSEYPDWNLFHLLHQESKDSENFNYVTPIDYEHPVSQKEIQPTFSIESKFVYSKDEDNMRVTPKMYTVYLTKYGVDLVDDNTGDEKQILDLKMFNRVTWCYDIDEAYNFKRGIDPKRSMSTGKFSEANKVKNFLTQLKGDFQLDKSDDRYLGFINVYEDGFVDQDMKDAFAIFVKTWPKYKKLMEETGLELPELEPDIEETLFQNKK